MVAVKSTMQSLGSAAPEFSLPDMRFYGESSNSTNLVSLQDFNDKPVLIMFICNHCPYVIHVMRPLAALANQYQSKGFAVIAISSNDVDGYPQDGPEAMCAFAKEYDFEFPYAYDESQQVAKDYGAACTPDFFVYDSNHRLSYRGQMDGSRPSNQVPVDGSQLQNAMQAVLDGVAVVAEQIPSMGCNIKWKPGNQPDYF